jgi:hypothetical protein
MNKTEAARKKAQWLAGCLDFGWQKSELDGLSEVWDRFKDEDGNMRQSPTAVDVPVEEGVEEKANAYVEEKYPTVPDSADDFSFNMTEGFKEELYQAYIAGALSVRQQESQDYVLKLLIAGGFIDPKKVDEAKKIVSGFPQSRSSRLPGILQKLRNSIPQFQEGATGYDGWNECCDTLARIIEGNQKPDEADMGVYENYVKATSPTKMDGEEEKGKEDKAVTP